MGVYVRCHKELGMRDPCVHVGGLLSYFEPADVPRGGCGRPYFVPTPLPLSGNFGCSCVADGGGALSQTLECAVPAHTGPVEDPADHGGFTCQQQPPPHLKTFFGERSLLGCSRDRENVLRRASSNTGPWESASKCECSIPFPVVWLTLRCALHCLHPPQRGTCVTIVP